MVKSCWKNPIEILDGVEEVLKTLKGKYRLVVATKGDMPDQERKLKKSGLEHHFHHTEIMSDVMPVLAIGGHPVHISYHTTWAHE